MRALTRRWGAIAVLLLSASAYAPRILDAAPPPVYGQDDTEEVAAHPDPALRAIANSVVALVPARDVHVRGDGVVLGGDSLEDYVRSRCGGPLCDGGRFSGQLTPAFCSGFLVAPDLVVTAGHCLRNERACQRTRYVLDFKTDRRGIVAPLDPADIFRCASLVQRIRRRGVDFAIVRLDRDTGRPGLELETREDLGVGTPLALIGHPFGLPMKIAAGAMVVEVHPGRPVFETTLDALDASSGSPVINLLTYRVEGILVAGDEDFVETDAGCFALKRCRADGSDCQLEDVTRMSVIAGDLP